MNSNGSVPPRDDEEALTRLRYHGGMMFGPRLTTVFASRWKAVLWACSILMTAYCTVPAAPDAEVPAVQQKPSPPPVHHRSPWAIDRK